MSETNKKPFELDEADFNNWLTAQVKEGVEKTVAELGLKPGEKEKKVEPIKVKLGDKEYAFNSQDELQTAFTNFANNYEAALEEAKKEPEKKERKPREKSFDKDVFASKFVDDTPDGISYALEHKLGYPVDRLRELPQVVESQRQFIEALRFQKSNPDFPENDPKLNAMIGSVMQNTRLPQTAEGLTAAWALVKQSGGYKVPEKVVEQTKEVSRVAAPPTPGRKVEESDSDMYGKLNDLSFDEIEKLVKRAGLL